MNIIITLIVILILSYSFIWLAKKLKVSDIVTLILLGLIIGIGVIKENLITPNMQILFSVGDLGLICLMFLAGLESEWKVLWDEEKEATIITLGMVFRSMSDLCDQTNDDCI